MKIEFYDSAPLNLGDADKVRLTPDGYLVATPRVARTGIQIYRGSEIGLTGDDAKKVFRIYRPEDQVFDTDSMRSFAHKPITDDHPPEAVDSLNWRKYSRGQIGDEVARDGDFVRVPMVLMDAELVKKVKSGKAELSVGYACDVEMTSGVTPTGEAYDGVQKCIHVNHTAVVDAARAGRSARIGDGSGDVRVDATAYATAMTAAVQKKVVQGHTSEFANSGFLGTGNKYPVLRDGCLNLAATRAALTDSISRGDGDVTAAARSLLEVADERQTEAPPPTKENTMTKHVVDGITVEMDDTAIQVVDKTINGLRSTVDALKATATATATDHAKVLADRDAQIAKLTTDLATVTTEKATLETKLKDATVTPQKLEQMVADRQVMVSKAKVLMPEVVVDGKTDAEIRKQVVAAKVGDASKDWSDDTTKVSFDTLAASVTDEQLRQVIPGGSNLRDAANALTTPASGSQSVYAKRDRALQDAWKQTPGAA